MLLPAFKKVEYKSEGKAIKQDTEEKIKAGHVDVLYTAPKEASVKEIKHDWLWSRMGGWFKDNGKSPEFSRYCVQLTRPDIILTETGTSSFGLTNVPLPSRATYMAQVLWGSIGWSVGATLGAALAATEAKEDRRTVLFVGDGSLQLVSRAFNPLFPLTDGPADLYRLYKRSVLC